MGKKKPWEKFKDTVSDAIDSLTGKGDTGFNPDDSSEKTRQSPYQAPDITISSTPSELTTAQAAPPTVLPDLSQDISDLTTEQLRGLRMKRMRTRGPTRRLFNTKADLPSLLE